MRNKEKCGSSCGRKRKGRQDIKCVFSVDNAFIVRTWDENMEKLTRRPARTVIGEKLSNALPMLYEKVALVSIDGKNNQLKEFHNLCLFGSDFTADIRLMPKKDKNGRTKGVTVILENFTGGCPLDKRLSDSEKMIAIGKVASTLAHGIRNPLNAIKGAVVYLHEKYGKEPTLAEFSKIINSEIDRLDNFISNFLSSARETNKLFPVYLNDILKAILSMIKPITELQGISVFASFSALPHIVIDSFQAEQALFNIINNAIEAMPDGGTLDVKTSSFFENGSHYAVVEVSDTGRGISKEALSKLGELSAKPERNGRGFGIFLSREIIKSYGGKLFCESKKNAGTTFKVFLPLKENG